MNLDFVDLKKKKLNCQPWSTASHHIHDRHVAFLFMSQYWNKKLKKKNACEFLFSSHHNTKLQLNDKNIRTHTPMKL